MTSKDIIKEKIGEAVASVLPITVIVALLCLFFVPVSNGLLLSFLIGSLMLIVGMGLFTLGADMSMTQIGSHIGVKMTQSRKLWFILILSLVLGVAVTVAEPDLQVLASNVPGIDRAVLMGTVSVGVGLFLMISMLRILFGIPLRRLLLFFYIAVFALAALSDPDFLSVAFYSGGVASGPLTATFMLPFAMGATTALGGNIMTDAFGLVALVAMMPLITVQLMGAVYVMRARRAGAGETAAEYGDDAVIELWEVS